MHQLPEQHPPWTAPRGPHGSWGPEKTKADGRSCCLLPHEEYNALSLTQERPVFRPHLQNDGKPACELGSKLLPSLPDTNRKATMRVCYSVLLNEPP